MPVWSPPISIEVSEWLGLLRLRASPANSHTEPGPSPSDVLRLLCLVDELASRCHRTERLLISDLRSLPTDEFIARGLEDGLYRADIDSGHVYSALTGRAIGRLHTQGYVQAQFTIASYQRSVLIHRVIAVAKWGVDAVRGKQIAHLDHNRTDNRGDNLQIMTSEEHTLYDQSEGRRKRFYPRGTPCARCGRKSGEGETRWRFRLTGGERFGVNGPLCDKCYHNFWHAARKAAGVEIGGE